MIKNIKTSISLTMIIVSSVSGMDNLSPISPMMKAFLSLNKQQKKQQRLMEAHRQSQRITMQNHELGQQIATDNHAINQQQAKERLKMAKDNHQVHQQDAKFRQQVDEDNHIDNQLLALAQQRREDENHKANSLVTFHQNQTKIALAQEEFEQIKAKTTFKQCLVKNISSDNLGIDGIPNACVDFAKILRVLNGSDEVDRIIEDFKK